MIENMMVFFKPVEYFSVSDTGVFSSIVLETRIKEHLSVN